VLYLFNLGATHARALPILHCAPSSRDADDAEARFSTNLAHFSVERQNFAVLALRYFPRCIGAALVS
jgi:hypothetical protein